MCGIFGIMSDSSVSAKELRMLACRAEQRGKDSSGLLLHGAEGYRLVRANTSITSLLDGFDLGSPSFVMGHSRLITNGLADNQPVLRDGVCVIHNGIVVNDAQIATLNCDRDSKGDVWFADMGVSIVCPENLDHLETGLLPQKWMGQRIHPIKNVGGLDLDYPFQMPQAQWWLENADRG